MPGAITEKMKKMFGSLAMLVATLLWGTAFSAQSMGMKFLKPMVFTTLRSVVGVAALAVISCSNNQKRKVQK